MQIEVYNMEADESNLTIALEAVCDSFSSLLWDIEYYQCGSFEVYIAANPENLSIFQTGCPLPDKIDTKKHTKVE